MLTFDSRIRQFLFYDTEWIPRAKEEWSLQELKDWRILKQNKNSLLFAAMKQEVQGLSGHTPWGSTQGVPVFWKTCLFWSAVELNGTWFTSYFPQTSHQIGILDVKIFMSLQFGNSLLWWALAGWVFRAQSRAREGADSWSSRQHVVHIRTRGGVVKWDLGHLYTLFASFWGLSFLSICLCLASVALSVL